MYGTTHPSIECANRAAQGRRFWDDVVPHTSGKGAYRNHGWVLGDINLPTNDGL